MDRIRAARRYFETSPLRSGFKSLVQFLAVTGAVLVLCLHFTDVPGLKIRTTRTGAEVQVNYYDLLGLQMFAPEEEVRAAYRQKAKMQHPDKDRNCTTEEAHDNMCRLNEAYQTLTSKSRCMYDYKLGCGAAMFEACCERWMQSQLEDRLLEKTLEKAVEGGLDTFGGSLSVTGQGSFGIRVAGAATNAMYWSTVLTAVYHGLTYFVRNGFFARPLGGLAVRFGGWLLAIGRPIVGLFRG